MQDLPDTSIMNEKFREQLRILRENRKTRNPRSLELVVPPSPRYDEVYEQGLAWLNGLDRLQSHGS